MRMRMSTACSLSPAEGSEYATRNYYHAVHRQRGRYARDTRATCGRRENRGSRSRSRRAVCRAEAAASTPISTPRGDGPSSSSSSSSGRMDREVPASDWEHPSGRLIRVSRAPATSITQDLDRYLKGILTSRVRLSLAVSHSLARAPSFTYACTRC